MGIKWDSSTKEDEVGIQVSQNSHSGPLVKGTSFDTDNGIIHGIPVNYA